MIEWNPNLPRAAQSRLHKNHVLVGRTDAAAIVAILLRVRDNPATNGTSVAEIDRLLSNIRQELD